MVMPAMSSFVDTALVSVPMSFSPAAWRVASGGPGKVEPCCRATIVTPASGII